MDKKEMNEIKRIQKIELEMLKVFHSICIDNNLSYYAVGGTLLGAIRHSGFIPWDDDIDLAMPREHFQRFVQIAGNILPEHLKLSYNELNLNTLQLTNIRTKVIKGKKETPLYIDIFPLDGFPENTIQKQIHEKRILFRRMMCKLSVVNLMTDRDRGTFENLIVGFGKLFKTDKLLNTKKQLDKLHSIIKEYSFTNSSLVGNVLGRYREHEVVPKGFFGTPTLKAFEDMEMLCPELSEAYLTSIYGNFMQLPPIEEQVPQNLKIITLGDSNE